MCLLVDPTDLTGRLLFEVYDWDAMTDDDLIGGFSISITELLYNPANGWFRNRIIGFNSQLDGLELQLSYERLLGPAEAEFYNIPLAYEGLIYLEAVKSTFSGLQSALLQVFGGLPRSSLHT